MTERRRLAKLIPSSWRRAFRNVISDLVREYAAPQFVYGYRDSSGEWRPRTRISNTAALYHAERLRIDDNVYVGHWAILDATCPLQIGEGTQIGSWVGVFTHSSHMAIRLYGAHYPDVPEDEKKAYESGPVEIGRYVFVGAGAFIQPGVTIGDGAVISAHAIVTKNVGPFSLVTKDGKEMPGAARRLDALNLNRLNDDQLREWYAEWQKPG